MYIDADQHLNRLVERAGKKAMLWETIYTASKTFDVPGDQRRAEQELWGLLKRLSKRRFWWGGRKMDEFQLHQVRDGVWSITLKVRRTDSPLESMWREVEQTISRLRENAEPEAEP